MFIIYTHTHIFTKNKNSRDDHLRWLKCKFYWEEVVVKLDFYSVKLLKNFIIS